MSSKTGFLPVLARYGLNQIILQHIEHRGRNFAVLIIGCLLEERVLVMIFTSEMELEITVVKGVLIPLALLPLAVNIPTAHQDIVRPLLHARENAEKKARDSSYAVRFEMAHANLLNYVEPKYKSESTLVHEPIYSGGPTCPSFNLWRCPIYTTETTLFTASKLCGHIINLRAMSNNIAEGFGGIHGDIFQAGLQQGYLSPSPQAYEQIWP
ncbi:hypothetical protein DFH07DRAFT_768279 [Mycena maculata]|uniref:Uncharacterized protein n=1 Tax=Mycena maculata TaxID=230809 RepID=A0AAD7JSY5_9AGAR|nr:hypothetical protein DFH07DRAFT_768279 [Mycena maculata]